MALGHSSAWPPPSQGETGLTLHQGGSPHLSAAAPGRAGPSPSPPVAPLGPSPCHRSSPACPLPPLCPGQLAGPREERLGSYRAWTSIGAREGALGLEPTLWFPVLALNYAPVLGAQTWSQEGGLAYSCQGQNLTQPPPHTHRGPDTGIFSTWISGGFFGFCTPTSFSSM